jgi:hypothetical protein
MSKAISDYMSKIGRRGGNASQRKWTEEEKRRMVATKDATLKRKKELLDKEATQ